MARQQRFDWFLANQRSQNTANRQTGRFTRSRRPQFETLEVRRLLSMNSPQSALDLDSESHDANATSSIAPHGMWYVPAGEAPPPEFDEHNNSGNGMGDPATEGHDPGSTEGTSFEEFRAILAWEDQDPDTVGIQITYSYSNLFDGGMLGEVDEDGLRAATEEALGLWASVTPLHFIEVDDTGPLPEESIDLDYDADEHANIRIGHHFIDGSIGANALAHAFFPPPEGGTGQSGDLHFDNGNFWGIGSSSGFVDVIEVMTHELGHSLGLGHEDVVDAIMNPTIAGRFDNLGDGILLPDDIAGIQSLYGVGEGLVEPLTPFEVTTLDDVNDIAFDVELDEFVDASPDFVSLREAIFLANGTRSGRKISFAEDLFVDALENYTIDLDASLASLVISNGVIIEGPGSEVLTLQAPDPSETEGDGFQLFTIDNEDPDSEDPDTIARVLISGLTLTGGDSATAGGAIFSAENLSLEDVRIHDNFSAETGGAVAATGPLSISGSSIENNTAIDDGGAVHTTSALSVDRSSLLNNQSADEGGAIAAEGGGTEVVVTSSTISGNTATGSGGAIHILDENPTKFRVLHSTVYNNHADSDGDGSGSGGGIYMFDGVLALEHSIIGGNSDNGIAPDIDNVNLFAVPTILARYSLVENANGTSVTQIGPNLFGLDPMLEPLADNGGPTLTHEPLSASPVLNAGNPEIPFPVEFDQRGLGFRRIQEQVIDIGAVETGGFEQSFTVNSLADTSDIDFSGIDSTPDVVTLREALTLSNLQLGRNLINFDATLNGGTISLSSSLGELPIADGLAIDASGLNAGLTISAVALDPTPTENNGDGSRLFQIDDGDAAAFVDVELFGLTLTGGDVSGDGGAIRSVENLTLEMVSVLDSYATGNGGGVYHRAGATGGTLLIDSSTIAANEASGDGGGLWSNTSLPAEPDPDPDPNPIVGKVLNTTISGNVAGDEGGGVMNFDGQLELRYVTITENQAAHGSGIVSFGDSFTKTLVYSSIIAGNVVNLNDPGDITDDTGFDVQKSREVEFNSFESLGYNLVGIGSGLLAFNNNDLAEVTDPRLQPLANNGGRTMTHALQPDSPAVDSGDPNAVVPIVDSTGVEVVVAQYDQRGEPFSRIGDGDGDGSARLDIGAFEIQSTPSSADFDDDGDTDGADFLTWQRGFGKTDAQAADGDADFDGDVDQDDLLIWQAQFGVVGPVTITGSVTAGSPSSALDTYLDSSSPSVQRLVDNSPIPTVTRSAAATRIEADAAARSFLGVQNYFMKDSTEVGDHHGWRDGWQVHNADHHLASQAERTDSAGSAAGEVGNARRHALGSTIPFAARPRREVIQTLDEVFEQLGVDRPWKPGEV